MAEQVQTSLTAELKSTKNGQCPLLQRPFCIDLPPACSRQNVLVNTLIYTLLSTHPLGYMVIEITWILLPQRVCQKCTCSVVR